MRFIRFTRVLLVLALVLACSTSSLSCLPLGPRGTSKYEKNGVAFEYPRGWKVSRSREAFVGVPFDSVGAIGDGSSVSVLVPSAPVKLAELVAEFRAHTAKSSEKGVVTKGGKQLSRIEITEPRESEIVLPGGKTFRGYAFRQRGSVSVVPIDQAMEMYRMGPRPDATVIMIMYQGDTRPAEVDKFLESVVIPK